MEMKAADAAAGAPRQEFGAGNLSWEAYTPPSCQSPDDSSEAHLQRSLASGPPAISMDGVDACWTASQGDTASSTLAIQGLSLAILQGKLSVVTGQVGAGL